LDYFTELFRTIAEVIVCAAVPPRRHATVTAWCYALARRGYRPGFGAFVAGLHDWEAAALDGPPFPRTGRVLLGGAGSGRELRALLDRGFTVTAFEPSSLWTSARSIGGSAATVLRGSYDDLVRAVTKHEGPLRTIGDERFDLIVLGWGSLSHIINPVELRALFAALRCIGPTAPVLLSFQLLPYPDSPAWAPRRFARLAAALHRALHQFGAPGEPCPPGLRFTLRGGLLYQFSRAELDTVAADTGYAVVHFCPTWYSHAVWLPRPDNDGSVE
jgi:hypothetical protein